MEAIKSQTAIRRGIDNYPYNDRHLKAMKHIASTIFDPIREYFGVPIGISSFYRSPALNKAIGGSSRSQHSVGEAIDIDADMYGKISNTQIFNYIRNNYEFDQLISEYPVNGEPAWVHVSLKLHGENRNEVLEAYRKSNGKTGYKFI